MSTSTSVSTTVPSQSMSESTVVTIAAKLVAAATVLWDATLRYTTVEQTAQELNDTCHSLNILADSIMESVWHGTETPKGRLLVYRTNDGWCFRPVEATDTDSQADATSNGYSNYTPFFSQSYRHACNWE